MIHSSCTQYDSCFSTRCLVEGPKGRFACRFMVHAIRRSERNISRTFHYTVYSTWMSRGQQCMSRDQWWRVWMYVTDGKHWSRFVWRTSHLPYIFRRIFAVAFRVMKSETTRHFATWLQHIRRESPVWSNHKTVLKMSTSIRDTGRYGVRQRLALTWTTLHSRSTSARSFVWITMQFLALKSGLNSNLAILQSTISCCKR